MGNTSFHTTDNSDEDLLTHTHSTSPDSLLSGSRFSTSRQIQYRVLVAGGGGSSTSRVLLLEKTRTEVSDIVGGLVSRRSNKRVKCGPIRELVQVSSHRVVSGHVDGSLVLWDVANLADRLGSDDGNDDEGQHRHRHRRRVRTLGSGVRMLQRYSVVERSVGESGRAVSAMAWMEDCWGWGFQNEIEAVNPNPSTRTSEDEEEGDMDERVEVVVEEEGEKEETEEEDSDDEVSQSRSVLPEAVTRHLFFATGARVRLCNIQSVSGVFDIPKNASWVPRVDTVSITVTDLVCSPWSFPGRVVSAYSDGCLRVFDPEHRPFVCDWDIREDLRITALGHAVRYGFREDQRRIYSGMENGIVKAWDSQCKKKEVASFDVFADEQAAVRRILALEGYEIVVASRNELQRIDIREGRPVAQYRLPESLLINDLHFLYPEKQFLTLECCSFPRKNALSVYDMDFQRIPGAGSELRCLKTEVWSTAVVMRPEYDNLMRGQIGSPIEYPAEDISYLPPKLLGKKLEIAKRAIDRLQDLGMKHLANRLANESPFVGEMLDREDICIVSRRKSTYATIMEADYYHIRNRTNRRGLTTLCIKKLPLSEDSVRELEFVLRLKDDPCVIPTLGWWLEIPDDDDLVEEPPSLFIVMRRASADGSLLEHLLRPRHTLEDRLNILIEVAKLVSALHNRPRPICHFDVKPENVLLGRARADPQTGQFPLFLCDFGSAWFADVPFEFPPKVTPLYMPPEVVRATEKFGRDIVDFSQIDPFPVDVYCFGILAYEALAGRMAYGHRDFPLETLMHHHAHGLRPDIAQDILKEGDAYDRQLLIEFVKRCWDPEPRRRPSFIEGRFPDLPEEEEEEEEGVTGPQEQEDEKVEKDESDKEMRMVMLARREIDRRCHSQTIVEILLGFCGFLGILDNLEFFEDDEEEEEEGHGEGEETESPEEDEDSVDLIDLLQDRSLSDDEVPEGSEREAVDSDRLGIEGDSDSAECGD